MLTVPIFLEECYSWFFLFEFASSFSFFRFDIFEFEKLWKFELIFTIFVYLQVHFLCISNILFVAFSIYFKRICSQISLLCWQYWGICWNAITCLVLRIVLLMPKKCDGSTCTPTLSSMSGFSPSRTSTVKTGKHQHRATTTTTTATKPVGFFFPFLFKIISSKNFDVFFFRKSKIKQLMRCKIFSMFVLNLFLKCFCLL